MCYDSHFSQHRNTAKGVVITYVNYWVIFSCDTTKLLFEQLTYQVYDMRLRDSEYI